jgi:flagellin
LSSGLRINSAKDDAAGLAISERFTAQIRGLNQGVRNANDGISLAQTAEGALKEVTDNLQRIRELAVQSANATNSASDRTALQAEVAQLVAEIDRVAQNTKFNGVALLEGTFTSKAFQIGADITDTVSITSIASARTSAIGGTSSSTAVGNVNVNTTAIDGTNVFINGTAVGASTFDGYSTANGDASALSKANAINAVSATTGVTATAATTSSTLTTAYSAGTNNRTAEVNGFSFTFSEDTDQATTQTNLLNAINARTAESGISATAVTSTTYTLNAADGRNITVTSAEAAALTAMGGMATGTSYSGKLTLTSGSSSGIQISATASGAAASNAIVGMTSGNFSVSASGSGVAVSSLSVTTAANATSAITSVDSALNTINSTRATLGSYQSRFESIVASSQTTAENLSASRSRIVDADFAAETASLTKAQILQQSGIAMLAQANAIPQNVLALLQ